MKKTTPTRGILSLNIEFPVSHQFTTLNVTEWMVAYLRWLENKDWFKSTSS